MDPLPTGKLVRWGSLAAILVIAILAFAVPRCTDRNAQTRVDRGQAEAGSDTGAVAINTLEGVTANDSLTDQIVANGITATRAVPDSQRDDVAKAELCKFKSMRDKPECQKGPR